MKSLNCIGTLVAIVAMGLLGLSSASAQQQREPGGTATVGEATGPLLAAS